MQEKNPITNDIVNLKKKQTSRNKNYNNEIKIMFITKGD